MNRKLTTGVPELHPIPVKAPWYMVGIDFIGPLSPVAKDGSRYILTISDYFTKWVEVVPIQSTKWHLQWQVHCLSSACVPIIYMCMQLFVHVAVHGFTSSFSLIIFVVQSMLLPCN